MSRKGDSITFRCSSKYREDTDKFCLEKFGKISEGYRKLMETGMKEYEKSQKQIELYKKIEDGLAGQKELTNDEIVQVIKNIKKRDVWIIEAWKLGNKDIANLFHVLGTIMIERDVFSECKREIENSIKQVYELIRQHSDSKKLTNYNEVVKENNFTFGALDEIKKEQTKIIEEIIKKDTVENSISNRMD